MSSAANSEALAKQIRRQALRMVHAAKASHIGACLSMADLLAVLYSQILNVKPQNPAWSERDRFLLSKGHAAAIYFALLAELGFFPVEDLKQYCANGSPLTGHANHLVPGIELSTGSLGHALPVACGLALGAKRSAQAWRTFVLLSDGEMDEGSNWEAILFAGHHHLNNLTAIVDYNKFQGFGSVGDVLELGPLADKFKSFRWEVKEIDGHNHQQIESSLRTEARSSDKPLILIAHTIKGKGVSFMENKLEWHYKSPNDEQLTLALSELA